MKDRSTSLLTGLLAALGNLEEPETMSRSTRDAFDVYCRKHWRGLFLTQTCSGSGHQKDNAQNELLGRVKSHMKSKFPELMSGERKSSSFEKIYNGLWEVTVVFSLQRPPLFFSKLEGKLNTHFVGAEHEFVDVIGKEGDPVVVVMPPIVKQSQGSTSKLPFESAASIVVEKGHVDAT